MCGIAGLYNMDGGLPKPLIDEMMLSLSHRGPDSGGVWTDDQVALAHRRLSILDLSAAGYQPMVSDEFGLSIVFNGEIYNFITLRGELEKLGYSFSSGTDTEVILKGYHAWGDAVFAKLRGMFALALWDTRTQELVLARDPFGIKPLYYTVCAGDFVFASEIKSLRLHPSFNPEIDRDALLSYIKHLYLPEPRSAYKHTHQLPAGCLMHVKGSTRNVIPYYEPPQPRISDKPYDTLLEETEAVLRDSVAAHLIADVPIGVLLSGGVDSSLIVSLMASLGVRNIKTFTIGFEGLEEYDERVYARRVAEQFHTEHHEIMVTPRIDDYLENHLLQSFDQPFANPAAYIGDEIAKFMRQHVTVALNGLGGDEFFAGYPRYRAMLMSQRLGNIPSGGQRVLKTIARQLPHSPDRHNPLERLRRILNMFDGDSSDRYETLTSFIDGTHAQSLFSDAFLPNHGGLASLSAPSSNMLASLLRYDQSTYMQGDLLAYSDRTSMQYGLEVRVPFCDIEVARAAANIPSDYLIKHGELKAVLKDIAVKTLPRDLLYRKKGGFRVPINEWLLTDLKPRVDELLSPQALAGQDVLNPEEVAALVRDFYNGQYQYGFVVWSLLIMSQWIGSLDRVSKVTC